MEPGELETSEPFRAKRGGISIVLDHETEIYKMEVEDGTPLMDVFRAVAFINDLGYDVIDPRTGGIVRMYSGEDGAPGVRVWLERLV
jgi:hypothetical protein